MGAQLWVSDLTGYRRRGTRLIELHETLGRKITVKAIYEPLQSFAPNIEGGRARHELEARDFDVVGVRESKDSRVVGYIDKQSLKDGVDVREFVQEIESEYIVCDDLPLVDLLAILAKRNFVFVRVDGEVEGILTLADLNKPVARIYLFGLISLLEMHLNFWVRIEYPDDLWRHLLSATRLEQLDGLLSQKNGLDPLDYLQFSDRCDLFVARTSLCDQLSPGSKRMTERALRRARELRDDLAHSQYYLATTRSWREIIELVQWADDFLRRSDGLVEERASNASRGYVGNLI
ncbi:hypothetical protein FE772_23200 [Lysobacter enzymogenes]|nr:hypothetical protein [Lysobacter enzymogenes]QCW28123.1 hypothetical protein FE772_23200 [Lysobacter enzymogenes]